MQVPYTPALSSVLDVALGKVFYFFNIEINQFKHLRKLFFINSLTRAKLQALGKGHLLFYVFIFFISFQNYVYLICAD